RRRAATGARDETVEAHTRDVEHLVERGLDLLFAPVTQSTLEGRQDARRVVPAHRDDERKAELVPVRSVPPIEPLVLFIGQTIEAGRGLLADGRRGHGARTRRLAGEIRMAAQQRNLLIAGRLPY